MPQDFSTGQVLTAAQMDTLSGAVDGYATTATAAGTTTLTTASMYQQFFTGVTTQTVTMPVASTLYVGQKWRVVNNSSGVVTVQSSGANTIYAVPAGGDVIFTCILASGTTAASWDYKNATSVGASGLTLITRQTFSGVANTGTTFDGVFSSTYRSYLLVIENVSVVTSADDLQFQFRYAGPTTQALAYYQGGQTIDYAGTVTTMAASNATELTLQTTTGDSTHPTMARVWVGGVGNASERPTINFQDMSNGSNGYGHGGGACDTARTYTGFLLKSSSTNISGTVAVYGLAAA